MDSKDKEKISEYLRNINRMSDEESKYLYGYCDQWCISNFKNGFCIVAIMEKDNHENGITHSYLRNPSTGLCYDVRGECGYDKDIIAYTGVDYFSGNTEEYVFDNINDFKKFLAWIDFEVVKKYFLA